MTSKSPTTTRVGMAEFGEHAPGGIDKKVLDSSPDRKQLRIANPMKCTGSIAAQLVTYNVEMPTQFNMLF
jgi:hypothetical protein